MSIRKITPCDAQQLLETGAALIDIREPDEHDRERIAGSLNIPLAKVTSDTSITGPWIFHCRSGMRTEMAGAQLSAAATGRDCFILEGGIDGWRGAGLPTVTPSGAPIEIQRQVMIAAGALVLAGTLGAVFAGAAFMAVPLFAGAGLMVAGITGFCGMARVLRFAPWNRRAAPPA